MLTGPPPMFHDARDILLRYTSQLKLLAQASKSAVIWEIVGGSCEWIRNVSE